MRGARRSREGDREIPWREIATAYTRPSKGPKWPLGLKFSPFAETQISEKYVNVQVPKDNAKWRRPWDCANSRRGSSIQKTGKLYGYFHNSEDPALADASSGAWVRDSLDRRVDPISQQEANGIAGAVLIRKPPAPGKMGHIAITDGRGGTVRRPGSTWACAATGSKEGFGITSSGFPSSPIARPATLRR